MKRRQFIKSVTLAALSAPFFSARNTLADYVFPDAGNIKIDAQNYNLKILPQGAPTKIWSFSDKGFAPVIRAKQDEVMKIKAVNSVDDEMGIHWHGIRLENSMDGVPGLTQDPIKKGGSFDYRFSSPDAGTFWYHTHSNSVEQVSRGLIGPLIIDEAKPYPVDAEQIILLNDWRIKEDNQLDLKFYTRHEMMHDGRIGNLPASNGVNRPTYQFQPNTRIRLRIINASNARFFSPSFNGLDKVTVIAIDGHPVKPQGYTPSMLGPGMRMDVVLDVPDRKEPVVVTDGVYRAVVELFSIQPSGKRLREKALSGEIAALPDNPIAEPKLSSAKEHSIALDGGAMSGSMMMGMLSGVFWTINGKGMSEDHEYSKPILKLKKNDSYIFTLRNNTRFIHPIHMHGHTFKVLSQNGKKLANPYWSDTVLSFPGEEAQIAFVADNPGLWMFHCHVLDHQVSGMMGVLEVG